MLFNIKSFISKYPACPQGKCDGGKSSDKEGFAEFAKTLSDAFKPEGLLLSAAVSPNPKNIDAGYDVPKLSESLDWFNVMTYDFHGSWDGKTGHNSPLYSGGDDSFSSNATINHYIERGAPPKKLVMGIPTYGQSFTLSSADNNGLNAPSVGAGTPANTTNAPGTLSFYEICERTKKNGWSVERDPENNMGPHAFKDQQWVSYDDTDSVREKAQYIRDNKLGGGMIWTLDFDDFKGKCGCGKYPLLTALNQELCDVGGEKVDACTLSE